jgi:prepilin-type N-terminal cleavage/methylation domain-containing protein
MRKLFSNKKKNQGFTLVELIVVLVILAILAAILVPALLGYIDRAKSQQIVLNAKSCLTAAQAEMSEMYGKDYSGEDLTAASKTRILETALDTDKDKCEALTIGCETKMTDDDGNLLKTGYKITYVMYTQGGKTIYYDGSSWDEVAPESTPTATYTIAPTE